MILKGKWWLSSRFAASFSDKAIGRILAEPFSWKLWWTCLDLYSKQIWSPWIFNASFSSSTKVQWPSSIKVTFAEALLVPDIHENGCRWDQQAIAIGGWCNERLRWPIDDDLDRLSAAARATGAGLWSWCTRRDSGAAAHPLWRQISTNLPKVSQGLENSTTERFWWHFWILLTLFFDLLAPCTRLLTHKYYIYIYYIMVSFPCGSIWDRLAILFLGDVRLRNIALRWYRREESVALFPRQATRLLMTHCRHEWLEHIWA